MADEVKGPPEPGVPALTADEVQWLRGQRDQGRAVACDAEFRAMLERHRCRPVVREVRDDGQVVQVQVGFVPLP